jgi:hypothetical protein
MTGNARTIQAQEIQFLRNIKAGTILNEIKTENIREETSIQ